MCELISLHLVGRGTQAQLFLSQRQARSPVERAPRTRRGWPQKNEKMKKEWKCCKMCENQKNFKKARKINKPKKTGEKTRRKKKKRGPKGVYFFFIPPETGPKIDFYIRTVNRNRNEIESWNLSSDSTRNKCVGMTNSGAVGAKNRKTPALRPECDRR